MLRGRKGGGRQRKVRLQSLMKIAYTNVAMLMMLMIVVYVLRTEGHVDLMHHPSTMNATGAAPTPPTPVTTMQMHANPSGRNCVGAVGKRTAGPRDPLLT